MELRVVSAAVVDESNFEAAPLLCGTSVLESFLAADSHVIMPRNLLLLSSGAP